jgi:O-antigen biosynthesis protein
MISQDWKTKDYRAEIQLESDTNSSFLKQLNLIGENKTILEFGCATGYFSQMLIEKGCTVVGVEINANAAKLAEQYCSNVIVADLDFTSLEEILQGQKFDIAVFGDVLEHLRDPWNLLESLRNYLNPGGFVVASIPNIAHGSVRLSLLQGNFNYQQYGILDNTHIRFFTRATVDEMFKKAGYFVDALDRTKVPILSDSNLLPQFNKSDISPDLIELIELDEESDTLQFIVRAYPESEQDRAAALANKSSELAKKCDELTAKNNKLREALSEATTENQIIRRSKWWRLRTLFSKDS